MILFNDLNNELFDKAKKKDSDSYTLEYVVEVDVSLSELQEIRDNLTKEIERIDKIIEQIEKVK